MLNFHFTRSRKTHAFTCVSLRSETDGYNVRYDFKDDKAQHTLAREVFQAILAVLDTLPYQHGIFHFPDFLFLGKGIGLSKAQVFQNVTSLQDATITFKTELTQGTPSQLMREFNSGALGGQSQALDLLVNTTLHVLNINALQLEKLESVIDNRQLFALNQQHAELVSLLRNVADAAFSGSTVEQAGLRSRLAMLAVENFNATGKCL